MFNPFLISQLRAELHNSELLIREALRGLSVKIVGGADEWDQGRKSDFTVRVNKHYLRQGGRVDALYVAPGLDVWELDCHPSYLAYSAMHVAYASKWMKCCTDKRITDYRYYPIASKEANPFGVDAQWCNTLCHELGTLPLTGIIAIAHLLTLPISSLHVTGFTFYASGNEIPLMRDSHQLQTQLDWLRARVSYDTRITIDGNLETILNSDVAYCMQQYDSVDGSSRDIKRVIL